MLFFLSLAHIILASTLSLFLLVFVCDRKLLQRLVEQGLEFSLSPPLLFPDDADQYEIRSRTLCRPRVSVEM